MDAYVSKIKLVINGQEIVDFSAVTEKGYPVRRVVKLMNGVGFSRVTPSFPLQVDYKVPQDKPEFDFESLENATLIIEYENGENTTYTGVCTTDVGDTKYDADAESVVRPIDMIAGGRD